MGAAVGGPALAVKVYELPPGQSVCPYHYEYEEEWLLVLAGSVLLRTPAGEQELLPGRSPLLPAPAPTGVHKVSNGGSEPARIMMFSPAREPAVAVYPDSGKMRGLAGQPR